MPGLQLVKLVWYILKPLLAEFEDQLEHKPRKKVQSQTEVNITVTYVIFDLMMPVSYAEHC